MQLTMQGNKVELWRYIVTYKMPEHVYDDEGNITETFIEYSEPVNSEEHRDLVISDLDKRGITDYTITEIDQTDHEWINGMTFNNMAETKAAYDLGGQMFKEREVRNVRNKMLEESDKTQIIDYPLSEEKRIAWREYRQQLRDISKQDGYPFNVEWPNEPS